MEEEEEKQKARSLLREREDREDKHPFVVFFFVKAARTQTFSLLFGQHGLKRDI